MSFILDALKKSESERNRQAGPALLEVRVAPRRPRLPVWAIVILVALGLNLIVIGYLLLRRLPAPPTPAQAAAQATVPAPRPAPAATPAYPAAAVPQTAAVAPTALPDPALSATPLPAARPEPRTSLNAADFAPALPSRGASAAQPDAGLGLPTLNDLNAGGANLPELHLSLHVFDPDPTHRYVLLNSTRLREGEMTPDGIRLERVTEAGVILAWHGRRFTLERGE